MGVCKGVKNFALEWSPEQFYLIRQMTTIEQMWCKYTKQAFSSRCIDFLSNGQTMRLFRGAPFTLYPYSFYLKLLLRSPDQISTNQITWSDSVRIGPNRWATLLSAEANSLSGTISREQINMNRFIQLMSGDNRWPGKRSNHGQMAWKPPAKMDIPSNLGKMRDWMLTLDEW